MLIGCFDEYIIFFVVQVLHIYESSIKIGQTLTSSCDELSLSESSES